MSEILHDWEAIREAGSQHVGGKAWNLARLASYGHTVPPGSAITVTAYRRWLSASGLEKELLAASQLQEEERSATLADVTAKLSNIPIGIDAREFPVGPLAVRSSAPQEDSATASFAGIHTSCLNVTGPEAVEQAIRTVWLSLWSPAAVAYRERIDLLHEAAAMAVLIMPLVPARAAGIVFTHDPISGRDDRMIIHAVCGLGESLVSGQTTGDEILIGEDHLDDHLTVLHIKPGDGSLCVEAATGGGTRTRHTTDNDRTPVLNEALALELAEQSRLAALALDYTRPDFDIEWTWDGGRFWLLQARPITAANRCTYPELATQPDIWSRGNTRDVVPDPLSPIDWGGSRRLVNAILLEGFQMGGLKPHPGVQHAGLFHGRLYLNIALLQWAGYSTLGVLPDAMNRLIGGHQPTITVKPPTTRERLRRGMNMIAYMLKAPRRRKTGRKEIESAMTKAAAWNNAPPPQSDAGFADALRGLSRYSRGIRDVHFLQGSASGTLNFLVDFIDNHLPDEGHALAAALMAGNPSSVTAQQGYDLIHIARNAAADPATRQWLEQRTAGSDHDWQELPEDNPFRLAFAGFLERYGHRGVYETYTRNPRWRERPGYLLDNLLALAETDLEALDAKRQAAQTQARTRVLKALPWWKRPMLDGIIRAAKEGSNEREAARSVIIALLEPARRLLLALGQRWVDAGWLNAPDEIFFLLQAETYAVLDGTLPGAALKPRIADRSRQFAAWQIENPAEVILQLPDGAIAEQDDQEETLPADGACFTGVPVGAGRATGTARLLNSPEQGQRLAHGDILVVPSTDPAWTPLFLKAGGLVMETGGYLSHGAIVAREFGIPAVVNLPGILLRLQDGDLVEVDGGRGWVRRIKG